MFKCVRAYGCVSCACCVLFWICLDLFLKKMFGDCNDAIRAWVSEEVSSGAVTSGMVPISCNTPRSNTYSGGQTTPRSLCVPLSIDSPRGIVYHTRSQPVIGEVVRRDEKRLGPIAVEVLFH